MATSSRVEPRPPFIPGRDRRARQHASVLDGRGGVHGRPVELELADRAGSREHMHPVEPTATATSRSTRSCRARPADTSTSTRPAPAERRTRRVVRPGPEWCPRPRRQRHDHRARRLRHWHVQGQRQSRRSLDGGCRPDRRSARRSPTATRRIPESRRRVRRRHRRFHEADWRRIQSGAASTEVRTVNMLPGVYYGGWKISGHPTLVLAPGIYIMAGGGIQNSGGTITSVQGGTGAPAPVLIYNTDNPVTHTGQASVDLQADSTLKLHAIDTGPYKGILLWNDGKGSNPTAIVSLGGQSNLDVAGTIYSPKGLVNMEGGSGVVGSRIRRPSRSSRGTSTSAETATSTCHTTHRSSTSSRPRASSARRAARPQPPARTPSTNRAFPRRGRPAHDRAMVRRTRSPRSGSSPLADLRPRRVLPRAAGQRRRRRSARCSRRSSSWIRPASCGPVRTARRP